MNIGIDLDDTISCTAELLLKYAKKYNKEEKINHIIQPHEWEWEKSYGWTEIDFDKFYDRYILEIFDRVKVKKYARKIIKKLKDEGNKIIIITARESSKIESMYNICKNWLDKNKILYDKIIIDSENKVEKCIENKIDIFIDDGVRHCDGVKNNLKIPVFIVNSMYNKYYKNDKIKRVYNWKEIYKEIQKSMK